MNTKCVFVRIFLTTVVMMVAAGCVSLPKTFKDENGVWVHAPSEFRFPEKAGVFRRYGRDSKPPQVFDQAELDVGVSYFKPDFINWKPEATVFVFPKKDNLQKVAAGHLSAVKQRFPGLTVEKNEATKIRGHLAQRADFDFEGPREMPTSIGSLAWPVKQKGRLVVVDGGRNFYVFRISFDRDEKDIDKKTADFIQGFTF
jgi:hypothetical protein